MILMILRPIKYHYLIRAIGSTKNERPYLFETTVKVTFYKISSKYNSKFA
jgi:hypothetical protein